jgi:hypothetical protein
MALHFNHVVCYSHPPEDFGRLVVANDRTFHESFERCHWPECLLKTVFNEFLHTICVCSVCHVINGTRALFFAAAQVVECPEPT